jgi:hypothetical protein
MTEEKTTPLRERREGWRQSSVPDRWFVIVGFPARAQQNAQSGLPAPDGDQSLDSARPAGRGTPVESGHLPCDDAMWLLPFSASIEMTSGPARHW